MRELNRRDFIKGLAAGALSLGALGMNTAFAEAGEKKLFNPGTYSSEQKTDFATIRVTCEINASGVTDVSYEVLDRTLRLTLGTWEGERLSLTSGMLKGIAQVVFAYGNSLNDELFKDHCGRISAKAISRTAKDRRPGTIGFAEALVLAYNGRSKKKLSLQKLYWSSSKKRKGEAPTDFETET